MWGLCGVVPACQRSIKQIVDEAEGFMDNVPRTYFVEAEGFMHAW